MTWTIEIDGEERDARECGPIYIKTRYKKGGYAYIKITAKQYRNLIIIHKLKGG